jgi:hypothetical protein
MEDPQGMAAPGVGSAWIDEVGRAELPDSVELLELRVFRYAQ